MTAFFSLVMLSALTPSNGGWITFAQNEPQVTVGTASLIDGYYVDYNPDLRAVWNASSFLMHDNGTIAFDMTLHHLSTNPTDSHIYDSATGNVERVTTSHDLRYRDSILLVRATALYFYNTTSAESGETVYLSEVLPVATTNIDDQSSSVLFRGSYDKSKDHPTATTNAVLGGYEVQLSWVRIFDDSEGRMYYQWLQGRQTCGENKNLYCPSQKVELDENYQSLSGSFAVFMPVPEEFTGSPTIDFDYVAWIDENVNRDVSNTMIPFSVSTEVDGRTYTLYGNASESVKIKSLGIHSTTISFDLDAMETHGWMELSLPKIVADNVTGLQVTISDYTQGWKAEKITSNETHTTVAFEVPRGAHGITINATQVIPEFSSTLVVAIAMAASIAAIVVRSRLSRYIGQK